MVVTGADQPTRLTACKALCTADPLCQFLALVDTTGTTPNTANCWLGRFDFTGASLATDASADVSILTSKCLHNKYVKAIL